MVYPKDWVPRHKESNVVQVVKYLEDCCELYIGENKQPLAKSCYFHPIYASAGNLLRNLI